MSTTGVLDAMMKLTLRWCDSKVYFRQLERILLWRTQGLNRDSVFGQSNRITGNFLAEDKGYLNSQLSL